MKVFLISDTHFGHENIIQYCGRPFANADIMDECIMDNWNDTVGQDDIIYHLGDVYFGKFPGRLHSLPGKKKLCLGNHDHGKDQNLQSVFEKIELLYRKPDLGCFLSHMPLLDRGIGGGKGYRELLSIHGHIHHRKAPSTYHVNVSVEMTDYKPIELEEVLDGYYQSTVSGC